MVDLFKFRKFEVLKGDEKVLYWVRNKGMMNPLTEGYIGQTLKYTISYRMWKHGLDKSSFCNRHNLDIKKLEYCVLHRGTPLFIDQLEFAYRPGMQIGWNYNTGGTKKNYDNKLLVELRHLLKHEVE